MNPTYKIVISLLDQSYAKNKRVLIVDYGCGNGKLLEYLSNKRYVKYYGFDTSEEAITEAKKKYKANNIVFKSIRQNTVTIPLKSSSIDVVVNIGVLQYLSNELISKLFEESKRVLRKGGIIVGSCFTDHLVYKLFNIYKLFLPHKYISHLKVKNLSAKYGFKEITAFERGLIFTPLLSNFLFLFFDGVDKLFFRTKGKLGLFGNGVRFVFAPITYLEFLVPINIGYTLFFKYRKL